MPDEITFMDLASLLQITPNTPLEKLGSALNASIFDASNVAGSLKQKGLIEFTAYYPGPNSITITNAGKLLVAEAEGKASEPFDRLDETILFQLSGGKRIPIELQNTINIRPRDLALRLYKLNRQEFVIYELKNGGVDIMLTEKGFLNTRKAQTFPSPEGQAEQPAYPTQQPQAIPVQQPSTETQQQVQATPAPPPHQAARAQSGKGPLIAAVIAVVIIIAILVIAYYEHII